VVNRRQETADELHSDIRAVTHVTSLRRRLIHVLQKLATSSDADLRAEGETLEVGSATYVLFALVVMHAFVYGALSRLASPSTFLLISSIVAVSVGQLMGVHLWRRRSAATTVRLA
jgi:hypothetical protein